MQKPSPYPEIDLWGHVTLTKVVRVCGEKISLSRQHGGVGTSLSYLAVHRQSQKITLSLHRQFCISYKCSKNVLQ
jgi:hypothetical protein